MRMRVESFDEHLLMYFLSSLALFLWIETKFNVTAYWWRCKGSKKMRKQKLNETYQFDASEKQFVKSQTPRSALQDASQIIIHYYSSFVR